MKIKLHLKVNVPGVVPPTIKKPSHQLLKWRYVKKNPDASCVSFKETEGECLHVYYVL